MVDGLVCLFVWVCCQDGLITRYEFIVALTSSQISRQLDEEGGLIEAEEEDVAEIEIEFFN